MDRLTINKPVGEMGMYELAHNCCYSKDGNARYRDFEKDMDSRNFARKLMVAYGLWQDNVDCNVGASSELLFDEHFDEAMIENLMIEPTNVEGLIALFYRNLWAMADLRETLKAYEDAEEQGLLLRLPCKDVYESSGDTVYYIFDYEIVECINCGVSMDCEGKLWIALACDEHIFPYREPIAEFDTDPTDWCINTTQVTIDEWGKTVFLTKEEAEQALAEMKGE